MICFNSMKNPKGPEGNLEELTHVVQNAEMKNQIPCIVQVFNSK